MREFDRIVNRVLEWTSLGLTVIFVALALLCVRGGIANGDVEALGYSISLLTLAFLVCPRSPARSIPLPARTLILVIAGILLYSGFHTSGTNRHALSFCRAVADIPSI